MNNNRLKVIETISADLLSKFNLDAELPIKPEEVAIHLGIEIIEHDLESNISGVLFFEKSKGKIGVNKEHPEVRKRFTIAHELGHYVLKHYREGSLFVDLPSQHMSMSLYRNSESSTGEQRQEREANAFAASLLMPAHLIKQEINKFVFDMTDDNGVGTKEGDDLDKMAKIFCVSSQAMAFRLSNLNYFTF